MLLRAGFQTDHQSESLLVATLTSSDARERILAARGAARRGLLGAHYPALLVDHDPEVRREVLVLLAHDDVDERTLEVLRTILNDDDPLVVDAALFALGEHEDAASVEQIIDIARNHDDARVRESAIAVLGVLGDVRAKPTVILALEDKAPVRRRAIVALANFEGPDVDEALLRASDDRDWQVRAAVDQLNKDDND